MPFLTLEDVNGTIFSNQGFHWHEIDLSLFSQESTYTKRKYDFCEITKESGTYTGILAYKYSIEIDNDLWSKGFACFTPGGWPITMGVDDWRYEITDNTLVIYAPQSSIYATNFKIRLYMGSLTIESQYRNIRGELEKSNVSLNYNELNSDNTVYYRLWDSYSIRRNVSVDLDLGYNFIIADNLQLGYLLVNLVKSDFKFNCNQQLIVNTINKVQLGVDSKYKPNGSMIGAYAPNITVAYNGETLPVYWDSVTNDYCFDLDLTQRTKDGKIRFVVNVDENEVINTTSTVVTLEAEYETIDTYIEFKDFIATGGTGRLGTDITLLNPLNIDNDVYIIGNDHTLDLNGHQLILKETRTLKADNTVFTNGINAIHQKTDSKLVLNECTFTDCTGTGSCIECDIELHSLDNPNDFDTTINKCSFDNNDMCILHGGDIEVTDSTINGKISNPNYPYFLYHTDGHATLLRNDFNISSDTTINHDIEFNSCIFVCGETALINGLDHTQLQNNNIGTFLEIPQNNQSHIDLSYYYDLIEDNITLQSDKGYCHSASGVDFVFKTNVNINRGE